MGTHTREDSGRDRQLSNWLSIVSLSKYANYFESTGEKKTILLILLMSLKENFTDPISMIDTDIARKQEKLWERKHCRQYATELNERIRRCGALTA